MNRLRIIPARFILFHVLPLQVEFDPSEIKAKIPPQEPYTEREAATRSDSKYDRVNPHLFVKHRESLDPRRYTADVEQLEKSALRVSSAEYLIQNRDLAYNTKVGFICGISVAHDNFINVGYSQ